MGGGEDADDDKLRSVECFDSTTRQWSAIADMGTTRSNLGLAAMNGRLYTVGGLDGSNTCLRSVECFDPTMGVWTLVAAMSTARFDHGVAVVNNKLYAVGGHDEGGPLSSVECFDPSTGQWSAAPPLPSAQYMHGVVALEDSDSDSDKLYVVGGYDNDIASSLDHVLCFDPSTGQWSEVADMNESRSMVAVACSMHVLS